MAYQNLAYQYDYLSQAQEEDAKIREVKKSEAKKLKLREQRRLNFFIICGIVGLFMAAYFMISKNVQVFETANRVKKLESELSMLESTTSQKIFELEQSVDLNAVERVAATRLNMQRPEKYQIVYLSVNNEDVTEITADDVEGVKNQIGSVAEKMKKNFIGIFDFRVE